jgi:hypothetical protein
MQLETTGEILNRNTVIFTKNTACQPRNNQTDCEFSPEIWDHFFASIGANPLIEFLLRIMFIIPEPLPVGITTCRAHEYYQILHSNISPFFSIF